MPKFPNPPGMAILAGIDPDVRVIPQNALLWRGYAASGAYPTTWNGFRHYGPVTAARFDHQLEPPQIQTRGIMYTAISAVTCIGEYFQRTRNINTYKNHPWLVGFRLSRAVSLLDLSQTWPTIVGASQAINSGSRKRARMWSQEIYEAYPRLEGLYYGSSMHGNHPCIALYERALDAIPGAPAFHRALRDTTIQSLIHHCGSVFGYGVV